MSQTGILKVAIYDDNAELRLSLSSLFEVFPEFELLGAYNDADDNTGDKTL